MEKQGGSLPDSFLFKVFERLYINEGEVRDLLPLRLVCRSWNKILINENKGTASGMTALLQDAKLSHGFFKAPMMVLENPHPCWRASSHCFWRNLCIYSWTQIGEPAQIQVTHDPLTKDSGIQILPLPNERGDHSRIFSLSVWEEEQVLCVVAGDASAARLYFLDLNSLSNDKPVWIAPMAEGSGLLCSCAIWPASACAKKEGETQHYLFYLEEDRKSIKKAILQTKDSKAIIETSTFFTCHHSIEQLKVWKERGWLVLLERGTTKEGKHQDDKSVTILDILTGTKKVTVSLPALAEKVLSPPMWPEDEELAKGSFTFVEEGRLPPASATHHVSTHQAREQHARYIYRFGLWKEDALTLYPLREPLHLDLSEHTEKDYLLTGTTMLGSIVVAIVREAISIEATEHHLDTHLPPPELKFFNRKGLELASVSLEALSHSVPILSALSLWRLPLPPEEKTAKKDMVARFGVVVHQDGHPTVGIVDMETTNVATSTHKGWFSWW